MPEGIGTEGQSIQDLAAQMLGLTENPENDDNGTDEEGQSEPQAGHPAWQAILDNVPEEKRSAVMEQLHEWDAGVSRRFQKIHDEYEPLKAYEAFGDPDDVAQAVEVYRALLDNPKDTWETIGRVYNLASNSMEEEDEDDEYDDLPPALKEKLAKLDMLEQGLGAVTNKMLAEQAAEEEAQEDQAFEDYMQELVEEYGEFDEDFVMGLIAAGIDGEEAVERYQTITNTVKTPPPAAPTRKPAPRVMSGSGGVPSTGSVDVGKLTNQETQALVMEALKLTQSNG